MITQYTRLIIKNSTGEIEDSISQDFPFVDGWEPVEYDGALFTAFDFEIDTDYPDSDFGIGVNQEVLRARKILENFEIVAGQPQLKSGADISVFEKVLRVSAIKSIEETDIKTELSITIIISLENGGSSEKELLDSMRVIDSKTPIALVDLKTIQLIRLKKALP